MVLEEIASLRNRADNAHGQLVKAVARARCENYSWTKIADALGCTRQAAREKYNARGIA